MYARYAKIRDAHGLTDYRVSQDTGISTATLTEWKQGKYQPKVDKIILLAKYFDVPLEELLEEQP